MPQTLLLKVLKMIPFRLLLVAALLVVVLSCRAAAPLDDATRDACVLVTAQVRKAGFGMASATATGFFVAPGLVLTCHHMSRIPTPLGDSPTTDYFLDTRADGRMPARVVARDARNDLLLLKVGKPTDIGPLPVESYSLKPGDDVTIIGHFPDRYRVSRGSLTRERVMPGFAMSSAKVRQGYSGGPVLDSDGSVQGILSQKDQWDNAVFAKSDAILALLGQVGAEPARPQAAVSDAAGDSQASPAKADPEAAGPETAQPLPRRAAARASMAVEAVSAKPVAAKLALNPKPTAGDEMVVAVPVRRRATSESQ